MRRNFLPALACSLAVATAAQPTWRFHLAFEDGTGARDTLWLVYDTTAQPFYIGGQPLVDYDLGEGPTDMSDGRFHVFTLNALMDSTNTVATPYSWYPILETGNTIDAINWTPPMTITWDTSLFHAPYLPYSQGHFGMASMDGLAFSQFGQSGQFGVYNMLIDDSVNIDFLWDYLFPFAVYFGPVDDTGITGPGGIGESLGIWPNPATRIIQITPPKGHAKEIVIADIFGRHFLHRGNSLPMDAVDISMLAPGSYIIRMLTDQSHEYHGTFEKIP